MTNLIQIKRSVNSATVPTLSNGEIAFTQNGATFWIGAPDGSGNIRIGGQQVPGTLTANQALVANSTSAIDKVIVANLVPTGVYANGSVGTAAYVLASGGSGANVYWVRAVNTDAQYTWTNVQTFSANVIFNGATVNATTSTFNVRDVVASGNLTINGTLTTVDAVNLTVKDNIIKLADQNSTTDTSDIGFYGVTGNSTQTWYTGLYRDVGASTLTDPVYKLFTANVEPTATVNATSGYFLGTLNSYLQSNALISNSTAVSITGTASIAVTIAANSVTLTTALAATSGGTGQNTYTVGDMLYASGTTALSKLNIGANGQVLQVVNNLPAYGTLDGGTF